MITPEQYRSYFENIAEQNVDIAHSPTHKSFNAINIDDLINDLNGPAEFPAMMLEKMSGRIRGVDNGNLFQFPDAAFTILIQCPDEDYQRENEIYNQAYAIGMEIFAYLNEEYQTNANTIARYFEPEKGITWENVGPVYDNCYGVRFQFSLASGVSLKKNPSKWL